MNARILTRGSLLAILGLALMGMPTVTAASPTTRMVDDDGQASVGNCSGTGAAKKKIQAAVNAAHNGDTILVCPGVYTEQVTITDFDGLTVKSVKPWKAVIKTPASTTVPYLVGIGVSEDVTFQGFKLRFLATDSNCDELPFGILTSEATGIVIRGNQLGTEGRNTLTGPCGYITGIQVGNPVFSSATAGTSSGYAWHSATAGINPEISQAIVSYNLVANTKVFGINAEHKGTNADISHNSVHYFHEKDDQNGNCASGPGAASALASTAGAGMGFTPAAVECLSFGIVQASGAAGYISDNAVLSGPGVLFTPSASTPVLFGGILQLDQKHKDGKTSVTHNKVFRTLMGIGLLYGDGSYVAGNHVWDNLNGINLYQTQGVTVENNKADQNGAGIGINDYFLTLLYFDYNRNSSDNLIRNNDARGNDATGRDSNDTPPYNPDFISCYDNTGSDNVGDPVDNLWLNNQGEDSSADPITNNPPLCGTFV
jgi:parallel beta-helix repeat protein